MPAFHAPGPAHVADHIDAAIIVTNDRGEDLFYVVADGNQLVAERTAEAAALAYTAMDAERMLDAERLRLLRQARAL